MDRCCTWPGSFKVKNEEGTGYLDMENYTNRLTFKDRGIEVLNISNDRMTFNDDYSVDFELTPEETKLFHGPSVLVQLMCKDTDGKVAASGKVTFALADVLEETLM